MWGTVLQLFCSWMTGSAGSGRGQGASRKCEGMASFEAGGAPLRRHVLGGQNGVPLSTGAAGARILPSLQFDARDGNFA